MLKQVISSVRALYAPNHIQYFKYCSYFLGGYAAYSAYDMKKTAWNNYKGIKVATEDSTGSIDLESLGLDADTIAEIRNLAKSMEEAPASH